MLLLINIGNTPGNEPQNQRLDKTKESNKREGFFDLKIEVYWMQDFLGGITGFGFGEKGERVGWGGEWEDSKTCVVEHQSTP